jgi:hypothetical protein
MANLEEERAENRRKWTQDVEQLPASALAKYVGDNMAFAEKVRDVAQELGAYFRVYLVHEVGSDSFAAEEITRRMEGIREIGARMASERGFFQSPADAQPFADAVFKDTLDAIMEKHKRGLGIQDL